MSRLLTAALCAVWFSVYAAAAEQLKPANSLIADLVITNARIWTVNPAQPEAETLAILRDRIVAIGKDADVRGFIGSKTARCGPAWAARCAGLLR